MRWFVSTTQCFLRGVFRWVSSLECVVGTDGFDLKVSSFLHLLFIVLQEEVVTGHGERSDQDDELCEIYLPVPVGVQLSHHFIHPFLILSILGEDTEISCGQVAPNLSVYFSSFQPFIFSYPQVVSKLRGKHFLELGPAQRVLIPLISRVLVEGLDHELDGALQGGGLL